MNTRNSMMAVALMGAFTVDCGRGPAERSEDTGRLQVALTKAPSDLGCLRLTVSGARALTKLLDLTPGVDTNYTIDRLPVGVVTVSADGFTSACKGVAADSVPTWVSEAPVSVRVDPIDVAKVMLKLLRNGRLQVNVDFEASPSPYLVPVAAGVVTKAILTVGDSVNAKPDGTPYRLVGLPDGLGAFDNGNGTFSLLVNHEISSSGTVRAHGAKGAFVSRWTVRKSDLTPLHGEDLIQQVVLWDAATSTYKPGTAVALSRFCSADLAAPSAFFDAASGLGYSGRLYTNGEEAGADGRAFAHAMDGISYQLPRIGKLSFENVVANPATGVKTLVAAIDDSTPGQVYFYLGSKTSAGTPVDKAGLTNGTLFGVKVAGFATEASAAGIPSGTEFTLADLGNVENLGGAALETASNAAGVTTFLRPEDGSWDPANPSDFYFVTTNAFSAPSRLWRLHFNDLANPAAGGKLDMLLDGTEGQKMLDNITVDKRGHVIAQEDVGNQDHIGKVWRYDIAADKLTLIAQHDPGKFAPGAAEFLTKDEESSGVIDASDLLGPGWFLLNVQAHYGHPDAELVEGGQLLAIFDPGAK